MRLVGRVEKLYCHFVETEVAVDGEHQGDGVGALLLHLRGGAEDVRVVLGEVAHAQQPVQRTGRLVAVHLAEFGHAQRQVAVALQATGVERHRAGAVHWFEGEHALVFGGGGEHGLAVVEPVPGGFPEAAVHHVRGVDLDIAGGVLLLAHVADQLLEQRPALGVPEHRAGGAVVEVEQVELGTELAVVALAGFFQAGEVGLEFFRRPPAGAVDALQRGVFRVAAPVGTGHFGQFEGLQQAGARDVRATAKVFEIALAVQRQHLVGGNVAD